MSGLKRCFARFGVLIGLLSVIASLPDSTYAEEPPPTKSSPLQQQLEAFEQSEQQIKEIRISLKSASPRKRRRELKLRLRKLEAAQEQLLQEIDRLIGGLPPSVTHSPSIALEQNLEIRQRHQEAILDDNADRRLPSN